MSERMVRAVTLGGANEGVREIARLAGEMEAAGFEAVYVRESVHSAFVQLAAMAATTERMRLGSYIANAYARTPFLTGLSALDLDELCGGRLVLGIGSGNPEINARWQGLERHPKPLSKLRDHVRIVKAMVRAKPKERVTYEGPVHSIDWTPAAEPVRDDIPICVSAHYPKTIALAAEEAESVGLAVLASPAYIADVVRPMVRSAAEGAGRDPDAVRILVSPSSRIDPDRERARLGMRREISAILSPFPYEYPHGAYFLSEQGFAATVDAVREHLRAGRREAALDAIDDEILDTLTITGTPDEARERAAAYEGAADELIARPQSMAHVEALAAR